MCTHNLSLSGVCMWRCRGGGGGPGLHGGCGPIVIAAHLQMVDVRVLDKHSSPCRDEVDTCVTLY